MDTKKLLLQDIKKAEITDREARFLVDTYYRLQDARIRAANQASAMKKSDNPCVVLEYFSTNYKELETQIKYRLRKYAASRPIGKWLLSICGIGPVLAAGLISNIDIHKVRTYGQIQAYAGLDPNRVWHKGHKRPFNAALKLLVWKIGQSFVISSTRPGDMYGKLYHKRKAYELEKNTQGAYKEQAAKFLQSNLAKKNEENRKEYEAGRLPVSHINQRAARYAVKIFLSHLFYVWYVMENKTKPPCPLPDSVMGESFLIPNWDGNAPVYHTPRL